MPLAFTQEDFLVKDMLTSMFKSINILCSFYSFSFEFYTLKL